MDKEKILKIDGFLMSFPTGKVRRDSLLSEELLSFNELHELIKEGIFSILPDGLLLKFSKSKYLQYRNELLGLDIMLIQMKVHPSLSMDWYRKNPFHFFLEEKKYVRMLSNWLFSKEGSPISFSSLQTRSMEVFGDEKFLLHGGASLFRHILKSKKMEDLLLLQEHPNPLGIIFRCKTFSEPPSILILENRDIWRICGTLCSPSNHLFVLGDGNAIFGSIRALPFQIGREESPVDAFYAGDIDRSGIRILHALCFLDDIVRVRPFLPFYKEMLRLSHGKTSSKHQDRHLPSEEWFMKFLDASEQSVFHDVLERNLCIPQEILTNEVLESCFHPKSLL